jgi:hypothetical protein
MTASDDGGDGTRRIQFVTTLDRRRAEALTLVLRRRLKELGVDGATVAVGPARVGHAPGGADAKREASSP